MMANEQYTPRPIYPGNLDPQTYAQIKGNVDDIYYVLNQQQQALDSTSTGGTSSSTLPTVVQGLGIQGLTGIDGLQGVTGVTGETGLVGPTGAFGGPPGPTGIQGVQGVTGLDGSSIVLNAYTNNGYSTWIGIDSSSTHYQDATLQIGVKGVYPSPFVSTSKTLMRFSRPAGLYNTIPIGITDASVILHLNQDYTGAYGSLYGGIFELTRHGGDTNRYDYSRTNWYVYQTVNNPSDATWDTPGISEIGTGLFVSGFGGMIPAGSPPYRDLTCYMTVEGRNVLQNYYNQNVNSEGPDLCVLLNEEFVGNSDATLMFGGFSSNRPPELILKWFPMIYGDTGLQGTTGIQGIQGNTGIQGIHGDTGVQGVQGQVGFTGISGPTGIQGQTGINGIQGETGVIGPQGIVGTTGAVGQTGVHGLTGVQGTTGLQGVQGTQGTTGVKGSTGVQGNTGIIGLQGTTGLRGPTGIQGITGLPVYDIPSITYNYCSIERGRSSHFDGNIRLQNDAGNEWRTLIRPYSLPSYSFPISIVDAKLHVVTTGVSLDTTVSVGLIDLSKEFITATANWTYASDIFLRAWDVAGAYGAGDSTLIGAINPQSTSATIPLNSTAISSFEKAINNNDINEWWRGFVVYCDTTQGYTGDLPSGSITLELHVIKAIYGTTGVQGNTGTQGIQGSTGVIGPTGVQGIQGNTGVQGSTGTHGPTGLANFIDEPTYPSIGVTPVLLWNQTDEALFAGVTGVGHWVQISAGSLQGATGLQGPGGGDQGVTGLRGPTGIQGEQGNTGLSVPGYTGLQGTQGDTGTVGPAGATGAVLQGETGTQGTQGNTGTQGIQGINGATGLQGPQGFTGTQGSQGDTGVQGNTGIDGATGVQGPQGNTGTQGIQGTTGVQGNQGDTGIRGVTGVQGTTGVQGNTGTQGIPGTTGVQGSTGVQGNTGLTGVTGIRGTTGIQGTTGVQGSTGLTGYTGVQGQTGLIGIGGVGTPYYFHNDLSDISPYEVMQRFPGAGAEDSDTVTVSTTQGATGLQLGPGYLTPSGDPGITYIPAGVQMFHLYGKTSSVLSGRDSRLYVEVLKRDSTGIITHMFTSDVSDPLTTSVSLYNIGVTLASNYPLNVTDRILTRVYGVQNGSGLSADITYYYEGTSHSSNVLTSIGAGTQGVTGIQGLTGVQGNTGIQGIQGNTGAVGIASFISQSGNDTWINKNTPDTTHWSDLLLASCAGTSSPLAQKNTLIKWDSLLSTIPPNSAISDATITLTCYVAQGSDTNRLRYLNTDWTNTATWNTPWATPGGDYDTTDMGTVVPAIGTVNIGLNSYGLTVLRNMINLTTPHYGFALISDGSNRDYQYRSFEYGTASERPKLHITYVPAGPYGPTGIQGVTGTRGFTGIQGNTGLTGVTGLQGSQGNTGVKGTTGIEGNTGVQGIQGTTGVKGSTGTQGDTGTQGTTGVQGSQGNTGVQGTKGETGVQGVQGNTGPIGQTGTQGSQGDTGVQGVQGNTGPIGQTGTQGIQGVQGQTGPIGQTGVQGNTGPVGQTGTQGSKGDTGVQGVQGHTGPIGQTGTQGSQGDTGVQGIQGTQGSTGTQGIQGTQGNTGVQGNQGDTGTQGIQGTQGVTGTQGIQGTQGDTGVQGIQGTQGATGTQGIQGDTGTQGVQGDTGTQGVQGDTGTQGIQGNTGVSIVGSTGVQGETGTIGPQGDTGTIGPAGSTGVQGTQGDTGTQGVQGDTGTQGIQGTTGTQGIQGDTGTVGPQGTTGAGIDGATGIQGSTGVGTQGPTGLANFLDEPTYPSIGVTPVLLWNQTDEALFAGVTGVGKWVQISAGSLQGATGLPGSQGTTGTVGAQGSTGLTLQGATGLSIQGTTGVVGPQGSTGAVLQGATGVGGLQGTTGLSLQGTTGVQGTQGSTGISIVGYTGVTGQQGTTGLSLQGVTGLVGLQGTTGVGTQGTTGVAGSQGTTGIAGAGSTSYYAHIKGSNSVETRNVRGSWIKWPLTAANASLGLSNGITWAQQDATVANSGVYEIHATWSGGAYEGGTNYNGLMAGIYVDGTNSAITNAKDHTSGVGTGTILFGTALSGLISCSTNSNVSLQFYVNGSAETAYVNTVNMVLRSL